MYAGNFKLLITGIERQLGTQGILAGWNNVPLRR